MTTQFWTYIFCFFPSKEEVISWNTPEMVTKPVQLETGGPKKNKGNKKDRKICNDLKFKTLTEFDNINFHVQWAR